MLRLRSPRRLATRVVLVAALCAVAGGALPSLAVAPRMQASAPAPQGAYLSLGDSLAAGEQPDARGHDRPTRSGYADVVARRLQLRLLRLSCGGATTTTLLDGNAACQPKGQPGQLVQAERYLAAHHGAALVTVNIGDNDVEGCVRTRPASIDPACVRRGRAVVSRNLPRIARRLMAAAGAGTPVVGVVDYDQFLALWLDGGAGRRVARQSVSVILGLNALMARIYRAAGATVADAGGRFATADLTTQVSAPGIGRVPLAVARICDWTWACSRPPINHDDHARAAGYRQIAGAVLDAMPSQAAAR